MFTLTAVLLLVGVISLNWIVDPFGRFGLNRVGLFFGSEREAAYGMVPHAEYDGIILGSSKATEIQPSDLLGTRLLNTAWSAALPEEMLYFLRDRFDPYRAGRYVVIGFDFFMFNEFSLPFVGESKFTDDWADQALEYLLSLPIAGKSLGALWRAFREEPPDILPSGARNTAEHVAENPGLAISYGRVLEALRGKVWANYQFSQRRVEVLAEIKSLMERECTPTVVFLSPLHPEVRALIVEMQLEDHFEQFRAAVGRLFPDVIDLTASEWSQAEDFYRDDPFHYLPKTGADFFTRALQPQIVRAAQRVCPQKH